MIGTLLAWIAIPLAVVLSALVLAVGLASAIRSMGDD